MIVTILSSLYNIQFIETNLFNSIARNLAFNMNQNT
jgi:hypothetical protein